MSNKKRLFGTFGVRRTANDVLTPEFAARLAACYGTQIQGTVAVGGDTRTSSPMLMEAVKAGLLSSGCDVVDLGILPTPGVQYATRKYYDGGVMITASHNPPKYNGIKFLDENGIGIPDEMDLAIEELYFDSEPKRAEWFDIGQIYHNDKIIEEYVDEAISKVDAELRLILRAAHAAPLRKKGRRGRARSPARHRRRKISCERAAPLRRRYTDHRRLPRRACKGGQLHAGSQAEAGLRRADDASHDLPRPQPQRDKGAADGACHRRDTQRAARDRRPDPPSRPQRDKKRVQSQLGAARKLCESTQFHTFRLRAIHHLRRAQRQCRKLRQGA